MTTGELIRDARKKKGLTQKELGDLLGITAVGIAQWENGFRNPRLDTRQKLAKALDIDVTTLMSDTEKEDYFGLFGTEEERIQLVLTEIKKRITAKAEEFEIYGGVVTPETRRKWALELVKDLAPKYYVSAEKVRQESGMNSFDEKPTSTESSNSPLQVTDKILALLDTMNPAGRKAVLRHVQELSQIPNYKKV